MSYRLMFLVFLLRGHGSHMTPAPLLPALVDFEIPELDGWAVEETCRSFTTDTPNITPPATTKAKVTGLASTEKVMNSPTQPAAQSPPANPALNNNEAPIRQHPSSGGPITIGRAVPAARLFYHILANSRGLTGGSFSVLNSYIAWPIGGGPAFSNSMTSQSDELPLRTEKCIGQSCGQKTDLSSSDESSDSVGS